jgi:hypothetical protein
VPCVEAHARARLDGEHRAFDPDSKVEGHAHAELDGGVVVQGGHARHAQ